MVGFTTEIQFGDPRPSCTVENIDLGQSSFLTGVVMDRESSSLVHLIQYQES
jgi:hypothetical protein